MFFQQEPSFAELLQLLYFLLLFRISDYFNPYPSTITIWRLKWPILAFASHAKRQNWNRGRMMASAASSPSCLLLPRPTKPTPPPPLLPSTSSCRRPSRSLQRCRIRSDRPENPAAAAGLAREVASSSSSMEAAQPQASGGGEGQEAMKLLFVEMGVGYDQHGQDITAAAVRACRDAITSNSIPAFRSGSIPGVNTERMKLQIKLGVPRPTQHLLDVERVKAVFPYGKIISFEVVDGGMICSSGVCLEAMGDKNDDCYIVNAAVYVGY